MHERSPARKSTDARGEALAAVAAILSTLPNLSALAALYPYRNAFYAGSIVLFLLAIAEHIKSKAGPSGAIAERTPAPNSSSEGQGIPSR